MVSHEGDRSRSVSGPGATIPTSSAPGTAPAPRAPAGGTQRDETRPFPAEEARSRLIRFHDWFISTELLNGAPFLPDAERAAFLHYYREFPQRGDAAAIAKYLRALWRLDTGWVVRWIAAQPTRPRILDAGCGFGTFTMMFAAVGADVVGVDLRPDRLDAAERRLAFYEQTTGRRLTASYERADVTKPSGDQFDLVWVYNALSHIEPVEPFIDQMRAQIRPGGLLVVGDINGGHPVHAQHLAQVRSQVVQEYVAPDGTRHAYANERVFTPSALHKLMKSRGFAVRRHELFYGGVGRLPNALYAVLSPMQRYVGWNGRFALRQLMVATPR